MKKKKGFTLVELLGVIAILALIVAVAAPPIVNQIKKSRSTFDKATLSLIYTAADSYVDNKQNDYPNINENTYCVTLDTLIKSGELKESIINIDKESEIAVNQIVKIAVNNDLYNYSLVDANKCTEYSKPTAPELSNGMIPIVYNGTNWIKADINNEWYDYNSQEWANAVLVTAATRVTYQNALAGTTINEADVLAYLVWIPRYRYKLFNVSGSSVSTRQIEIVFEDKYHTKATGSINDTWVTHPAFTFGNSEANGIWVGKFETTGDATTPTVKPELVSLRSQNVSTKFTTAQKFNDKTVYGSTIDFDSHVMKNTEWGAVAYLSRSVYGINAEIYKNNSSSYYTGRSGGNVGGSQVKVGTSEYINTGFYTYDGKCATTTTLAPGIAAECTVEGNVLSDKTLAYKASTTGNIYGIYDMSGGAWEITMGIMEDSLNSGIPASGRNALYHSGFNGKFTCPTCDSQSTTALTTGINFPNNKYYDIYQYGTTYNDSNAYNRGIIGDATKETRGWYGDYSIFINAENPWFQRGGSYSSSATAGLFYFYYNYGSSFSSGSFRLVQLKF